MNDLRGAAGVRAVSILSLLIGLPLAAGCGSLLPEFGPGFFPGEGTSRGDLAGRCLALATLGGLIVGSLAAASGCVLLANSRRLDAGARWMAGAAIASLTMLGCGLVGALVGQSKGGMKEAYLMVVVSPVALVLLFLTATGVWRLRRLAVQEVSNRQPLEGFEDRGLDSAS